MNGKAHVLKLQSLISNVPERDAEVHHILEFQEEVTWDEVWIPKIAHQGWIVISGDRGKQGGIKKGEPLPRVCRRHGVTHVLFSARVNDRKSLDNPIH